MNLRIALFGDGILGRGYGTQATEAVVAYGFDVVGLHRISLGVYAFNPRAQRAYEKVGFQREGVRRDALYWEGEWHDEVMMAILAPDRIDALGLESPLQPATFDVHQVREQLEWAPARWVSPRW